MSPQDQQKWLALVLVPGLGAVKITQLEQSLGSIDAIHDTSDQGLLDAGVRPKQIQALRKPNAQKIDQALAWLTASPTHALISKDDPSYPPLLKATAAPPAILFTQGNCALLSKLQLAIVGSRKPTRGGQETAFQFAQQVVKLGLLVTSGLALGIDTASHRGALDAGGHTIAVMGCGLDTIYPRKNQALAEQIANQGVLVSEYLPGTKPLPENFPHRNRIISGMSLGVLVVEAAQKSGSLITAYRALEQSREVFAIPGSIHNPMVRGCHRLIREGAKLVETIQDITQEILPLAQAGICLSQQESSHAKPTPDYDIKDPVRKKILEAISFDPVSFDTLIERTGLDSQVLSSVLLLLELENKISTQAGGHYVRQC